MTIERNYKVLLSPHVSEKTTNLSNGSRKQIVFKVMCDATKKEIKRAVEALFEVQVEKVTVSNMKPKRKRFGQIEGKRNAWKKAYVCLKEGFDIDFANAAN
jgi:large subunit ribosomal protein L23